MKLLLLGEALGAVLGVAGVRAGALDHRPTPACSLPHGRLIAGPDYEREVNDYERCLVGFVGEQRAAMRDHGEAMDFAVDELHRVLMNR